MWTQITFVWLRSGTVYTVQKPTQRKWLRKKEANKKKGFLSKKARQKLSDKQKSLSYLDYLQAVQSFYSSDRDLYSRTLVFFCQSEVTSMQVNTLQGN